VDKITLYWIEHSQYDMETAEAMLKAGRYLYVTFMCQQAIEKLLKAIITTISDETPPRIHDLPRLAKLARVANLMSADHLEFCAKLSPFCIQSRYAEEREKLMSFCSRELAEEYLKQTRRLYRWLRQRIG